MKAVDNKNKAREKGRIHGFIACIPGGKEPFDGTVHSLKNYLETGICDIPSLTIEKAVVKPYKLKELIIPYSDGKIKKNTTKDKIIEFIVDNETVDNGPEQRASAYLFRKVVEDINPRRMGIKPLKQTISEIRRALKTAGISEGIDIVTKAVVERYVSDTYELFVDIVKRQPDKSLLYLTHEEMIPEVTYDVVILEDAMEYSIYFIR